MSTVNFSLSSSGDSYDVQMTDALPTDTLSRSRKRKGSGRDGGSPKKSARTSPTRKSSPNKLTEDFWLSGKDEGSLFGSSGSSSRSSSAKSSPIKSDVSFSIIAADFEELDLLYEKPEKKSRFSAKRVLFTDSDDSDDFDKGLHQKVVTAISDALQITERKNGRKKVNLKEINDIASTVLDAISKSKSGWEYFQQNLLRNFPRDVLINAQHRKFVIMPRNEALRISEGAERVFCNAVLFTIEDDEVNFDGVAHLENIDNNDFDAMKRQAQLSDEIYHDIYFTYEHTPSPKIKKLFVIEELYEMTLEQANWQGLLTTENILSIFGKTVENYALVRAKGLYHRDIKAANVLLKGLEDDTYKVKLTDLGKAFKIGDTIWKKKDAVGYGSVKYSSPEHFGASYLLEDQAMQEDSEEMFALGCLLYNMLNPMDRDVPWEKEVAEAIDKPSRATQKAAVLKFTTIMKQLEKAMETETESTRKSLIRICLALLEKNPEKRMQLDGLQAELIGLG